MTPEQAQQMVAWIAASWPDGTWSQAARDLWASDIRDLEEGALGTALARLRRTWKPTARQTHPAVVELYEMYQSVDTYQPPDLAPCDRCDQTGWEPTSFTAAWGTTYTAVAPCACPNGERRRVVHQRLTEPNTGGTP